MFRSILPADTNPEQHGGMLFSLMVGRSLSSPRMTRFVRSTVGRYGDTTVVALNDLACISRTCHKNRPERYELVHGS